MPGSRLPPMDEDGHPSFSYENIFHMKTQWFWLTQFVLLGRNFRILLQLFAEAFAPVAWDNNRALTVSNALV